MAEELILSKAPIKQIVYNDLYSAILYKTPADSQFTWTLPFLVTKPRSLLLCMYVASTNNGADDPASTTVTNGAIIGSPINSPFSSAPNTVSPYLQLTNFNVQLAGQSIYQQNNNYSFQQFQFENKQSIKIKKKTKKKITKKIIKKIKF